MAESQVEGFISMDKFEFLEIETKGAGVALIRIQRPKALNALNSKVLSELQTCLEDLAAQDTVRVVVLTGGGDKAFIAGADIVEMLGKTGSEGVWFAKIGHEVMKLLERMPKPTIAAVNGYALGGGCELALACDLIYASERAVFGQPEVGLGIIPGFGGTVRLMRAVGLQRAKELIFSGRKIKAQEAKEIGLVCDVFPSEGFLEKVLEIAAGISAQSQSAVRASKKLMNEFAESVGIDFKLDAEAQQFGDLFGSHDQTEGMTAFSESRKPKFQGL
jgi:enoyl-CoA hydratase